MSFSTRANQGARTYRELSTCPCESWFQRPCEFLDELVTDIRNAAPDIHEGEEMIEKAAKEVSSAIKRSLDGVRLIKYSDLPEQWRNNPFVIHGYRCAH